MSRPPPLSGRIARNSVSGPRDRPNPGAEERVNWLGLLSSYRRNAPLRYASQAIAVMQFFSRSPEGRAGTSAAPPHSAAMLRSA